MQYNKYIYILEGIIMTDKNGCVKKEINNKNNDMLHLIDKKIEFFKGKQNNFNNKFEINSV